MRYIVFLAATIVLAAGNVALAVPFFNSAAENPSVATTAPAAKPETTGGWKLPSLWGKEKPAQQETKFFYGESTTPPSTTQRMGSALTNNPVSKTVGGWFGSDEKGEVAKLAQRPDALSLNQPVGKPTPELFVSMAQVREASGDTAAARGLYQQALAADPKNVNTLREIGHFEDRQGRMVDAERMYQQAAVLAPKDAATLNDLALCQARQGNLQSSAATLNRAIELDSQKPLYRNNMATVLMEMGEQQDAMGHLMAVHPPAVAYFNMGHLLEKGGKLPAAAGHFAEAIRLDPTLQAAQASLARVQTTLEPQAAPQTALKMPATASYVAPATQVRPVSLPTPPASVWPSEPITPATPAEEPSFGPRLLPPVE